MSQFSHTFAPIKAKVRETSLKALEKGALATHSGIEELVRLAGSPFYITSHVIEGAVLPAAHALLDINADVKSALEGAIAGHRPPQEALTELKERAKSGARFGKLMHSLGKELYGSATFAGETLLAENDYFRLSYLPPKAGVPPQEVAMFHVGGFIPYGDPIFRLLPEANFFDRFLERGVPVYAMELKRKTEIKHFGSISMDQLIDYIDAMSSVAFHHHQKGPMFIEGYCGTALPMLAFLAAFPDRAKERFKAVLTMVAPIDGTKCTLFAELETFSPRALIASHFAVSEVMGGYIRGLELWASLDVAIRNVFPKTPLGLFAAGWKNRPYAAVSSLTDLTPLQRLELAGAYWISINNCRRFPMPLSILRLFSGAFSKGVKADGILPCTYRGKELSLLAIKDQTSLPIISIFGRLDRLIPDTSGAILGTLFGSRYKPVVHPFAGHVSYIFQPYLWMPTVPGALDPNPVTLMLETVRAQLAPQG